VLLIEACRAVGVPARFVGVPLWSDGSGNHSWVEIWDGGEWKFTGAAEPSGMDLNRGWFSGRASGAVRDDPRRAVWATTWNDSPSHFPMVWAADDETVRAVNVTDRYTREPVEVPEGSGRLYVRLADLDSGRRIAADAVLFVDGTEIARGRTRDDGFDANDHLEFVLPIGSEFIVRFEVPGGEVEGGQTFERDQQLLTVETAIAAAPVEARDARAGRLAIRELQQDLKRLTLADIATQDYATTPLSSREATRAIAAMSKADADRIRRERKEEFDGRVLRDGDLEMPFWYAVYGDPPRGEGRALYISMHGGGGAPKAVNDQQWENQKRLYKPAEGVYLAPRAPTDTWNLWHQGHIDAFYDRLIADLIVFENVDPDKVYFMGYSAGGDGVYQLAPRMADRLAAAAMMAGHPNETQPDGLRNLPFTLHMGGEDGAYKRNEIARSWKVKLAELAAADEGGYPHEVVIHEGKGHWMDREDAVAVPWMAAHRRNLRPDRIVWLQDDVTHPRFYWLAVDEPKARERIVVERDGNTVRILEGAANGLRLRVDDEMFDLDQPIVVKRGDEVVFEGTVPRTIAAIARTLAERHDPEGVFTGEIVIE
jgi:poly(3-hydroxybutyrate) depolymerase